MSSIGWFAGYAVVAIITGVYAWFTASDTGKRELQRGVMPRTYLLVEVAFIGAIWPISLPLAVLSDGWK